MSSAMANLIAGFRCPRFAAISSVVLACAHLVRQFIATVIGDLWCLCTKAWCRLGPLSCWCAFGSARFNYQCACLGLCEFAGKLNDDCTKLVSSIVMHLRQLTHLVSLIMRFCFEFRVWSFLCVAQYAVRYRQHDQSRTKYDTQVVCDNTRAGLETWDTQSAHFCYSCPSTESESCLNFHGMCRPEATTERQSAYVGPDPGPWAGKFVCKTTSEVLNFHPPYLTPLQMITGLLKPSQE